MYSAGSCEQNPFLHVQEVLAKDGVIGLFGRGLKTKILANGLQGMLFTVRSLRNILPSSCQAWWHSHCWSAGPDLARTMQAVEPDPPALHALIFPGQVLWRLGQDAWNKQVAAS